MSILGLKKLVSALTYCAGELGDHIHGRKDEQRLRTIGAGLANVQAFLNALSTGMYTIDHLFEGPPRTCRCKCARPASDERTASVGDPACGGQPARPESATHVGVSRRELEELRNGATLDEVLESRAVIFVRAASDELVEYESGVRLLDILRRRVEVELDGHGDEPGEDVVGP